MTVQTKIIGNFPGYEKPKRQPPSHVDIDELVICDDPLPQNRASPDLKYEALLSKMKPGKCIKCKPENVGQIAGAMRKHIERHSLRDHIVRTIKNYEGAGTARVWLLYIGQKPLAEQSKKATK